MNSIRVIAPYKYNSAWVFDDPNVRLEREPFVAGMDHMLTKLTKDIPKAEKGFLLYFSDTYFPDAKYTLDWWMEEEGGNWYHCPQLHMDGWLCPALFRYFDQAPKRIFVRVREKC